MTASSKTANTMPRTQFLLGADDVPTHWYNILADLPFPVPHERRARADGTSNGQRLVPQLPLSLYRSSVSLEPRIEIPEPVRDEYRRWRPTPLYRAWHLERLLDTPARIYYKYEGASPAGSHKLNTAVAQAYFYRRAGIEHVTTGTGAGQWGTALAMACQSFGLGCTAYMVRCSHTQKPYRHLLISAHGADVVASPSTRTEVGRAALARDPDTDGSLAIANAEAIEQARGGDSCRFSVGSGENHVLLHQTVIGEEALLQMELTGDFPDVVIGCMGAGSNFAGLAFPFYREKIRRGLATRLVAVEPEACPKLTRGIYAWDYNDFSGVTPMTKTYTLGHRFVSAGIHAGGLRYHAAAPIVSAMYHHGAIEAVAYPQRAVFEAGLRFIRSEKTVPAPESAHAIRCAVDEALRAREEGRPTVILFNLSGHGLLDLSAYEQYLSGQMQDCAATDEQVHRSLATIPAAERE
ncbi:TrpB-like pyridoxal phosphate-dependent enzyme [Amycolatopsis nigrescens]|uniref:TrpB-like pyridoxal phosphate-dependent enzyme n=1 Tax=Amycolatopsis nigrescens TaxID=381445 RepID=UPI000376B173|nr:TrpB-like pyridoxal phosphate-dependent enzyme [Amycolatopsis nigrescens]